MVQTVEEFQYLNPNKELLQSLHLEIPRGMKQEVCEFLGSDFDEIITELRKRILEQIAQNQALDTDLNTYHDLEHAERVLADFRKIVRRFRKEFLELVEPSAIVGFYQAIVVAVLSHDWMHGGAMGASYPDFQSNIHPTLLATDSFYREKGFTDFQRVMGLEAIVQTSMDRTVQIQRNKFGSMVQLSDVNVRRGARLFICDALKIYQEMKPRPPSFEVFFCGVRDFFLKDLDQIILQAHRVGLTESRVGRFKRKLPFVNHEGIRREELLLWQEKLERKKEIIQSIIEYEARREIGGETYFPNIKGVSQADFEEMTSAFRDDAVEN